MVFDGVAVSITVVEIASPKKLARNDIRYLVNNASINSTSFSRQSIC